jgi:DNA ligase 1
MHIKSASMDRPMLAAAYRDGVYLSFPLLATPKIDGVRAIMVNGRLVSRSFKLIPNANLRMELESLLLEGADGEISCTRRRASSCPNIMIIFT